jgi:hypothetical protein
LRKVTTSLLTSANRSIKTRWPATLRTQVVQERHHIGREVANTVVQRPFPAHIEGYGAKVAREGRDLLEPPPTPEAKAVYQDQWRPLSVDVLVYAGVLGDNYRHIVTSRPAPFAVAREQLALCLKRPPQ